jgi:Tfp pilus assembly protein PilF
MQSLAFHQKGNFNLAQEGYEQVLALEPKNFDALHMLGVLATQINQPEQALSLIEQALRIKPEVAGAYENLGIALRKLNRFEEALINFNRAIKLEPSNAQTYTNRGVVLRNLHRYSEAIASYNDALLLTPNLPQALYNRGLVRNDLNLLAQAVLDFDATLELLPSFYPALWAKAICLLQMGDYSQGWPLYVYRWQQDEKEFTSQALKTPVPVWRSDQKIEKLLIWPEQGVGDELMFGSLLPQALQLCSSLLVQMDSRLIPLFQRTMPSIQFISKHKSLDPHLYDAHLPMGDLPSIFCNQFSDFQAIDHPYIKADIYKVKKLKATLSPQGKKLCGISWRSKNIKKGIDRSLPLKELVLALAGFDVQLVNLQYGDVEEELNQIKELYGIEILHCDEVDNQNDLDGLSALIQACDLVVSADNSTVHLAGALGQTVWVLLPFNADWRWLLGRNDSPWYPSANLFRQTEIANWSSVFKELTSAFAKRFRV